jgi:hypothetical protein
MGAVKISQSIERGTLFLASRQLPDGGFTTTVFMNDTLSSTGKEYKIVFGSALILRVLGEVTLRQAQTVKDKLAQYLLSQKSERWSLNYWDRGSHEYKTMSYPDDLDDTFCALAGLWLHDSSLVDETVLAHSVKLLLATESHVGGPYKTWLVPPGAAKVWQDVDVAVNANVAYFLSLIGSSLPNVADLLERAVQAEVFASPYYPHEELVAYYVASVYKGRSQKKLTRWLRQKLQSTIGRSPLRTALCVSSLIRLSEVVPEAAIEYLIKTQQTDGSWQNEAVWLDRKRGGETYYAGSSALVTAFAIEALEHYSHSSPRLAEDVQPSVLDPRSIVVFEQARQEAGQLDKTLRRSVLAMIDRTASGGNAREITLLPYLVASSLKQQRRLSRHILNTLSLANLYGWIAYTIYDDFLDDEGDPRYLSAANVMMRRSVESFGRVLPKNHAFQHLVRDIFDTIDAANVWEVTHARFVVDGKRIRIAKLPDYKRLDALAERSLGHALPALGVVAAASVSLDQESTKQLLTALRHYIIARQLNDDLHDWKEDLQAGRITYVVTRILGELNYEPGEYAVDQLIPKLERQFWHHTLPQLCKRMKYHTRQSKVAIRRCDLFQEQNFLRQLVEQIDLSINETLATLGRTERFLDAYNN